MAYDFCGVLPGFFGITGFNACYQLLMQHLCIQKDGCILI